MSRCRLEAVITTQLSTRCAFDRSIKGHPKYSGCVTSRWVNRDIGILQAVMSVQQTAHFTTITGLRSRFQQFVTTTNQLHAFWGITTPVQSAAGCSQPPEKLAYVLVVSSETSTWLLCDVRTHHVSMMSPCDMTILHLMLLGCAVSGSWKHPCSQAASWPSRYVLYWVSSVTSLCSSPWEHLIYNSTQLLWGTETTIHKPQSIISFILWRGSTGLGNTDPPVSHWLLHFIYQRHSVNMI